MRKRYLPGLRPDRRPRGGAVTLIIAAWGLLAAACGGPQMKMLTDQPTHPLDPSTRIEVFIGEIKPPYQEVAIIESDAFSYVDNEIKKKQLEQVKDKARRLGANAVQNLHILTKKIKGYTIDERVPFNAWQQGQYELYFMRGTAIRVPESEPSSLDDVRPPQGWVIDKLTPPQPLAAQAIPMPTTLQSQAAKPAQAPAPAPAPVVPAPAARPKAPVPAPPKATPAPVSAPAVEPAAGEVKVQVQVQEDKAESGQATLPPPPLPK